MFSLKNRLKISYIDKNSFFFKKYNLFTKTLSEGSWYFENSPNHFLGFNYDLKNFNKKDFTLKLEDCY